MLEAAEEIWEHNAMAAADDDGADDNDAPSLPQPAGLSRTDQATAQQSLHVHTKAEPATHTKIKIQQAASPALPIPVDTDLDELD